MLTTSNKLKTLNDFYLKSKNVSSDANYIFNCFIINQFEVLNQRQIDSINALYIKHF
jgi:hypothetical protein